MTEDRKLPRLHELIAVKASLRSQSAKTTAELANTFEKKQHHFTAKVKTFTPNGEDVPSKTEEQLDLQTTVRKELLWLKDYIVKAIDASHAVNTGNRTAQADIVLEDGKTLVPAVPSSTLLELEGELEQLRAFIDKIPTLDPAKGFKPAEDREPGVYVAREIEKTRTKKDQRVVTLAPATDKHPAQVQLLPEDVPIGVVREQEWSSMLTIVAKGEMLDRVEKLSRAVKKARSRANEQPVESVALAETLIGYVFGL